MQGHTARGVAYYRCRYPQEYALANTVSHPTTVYIREDAILPTLDSWLARALAPPRLSRTLDTMLAAQTRTTSDLALEQARRAIEDSNAKLARYRAALDAGADPTVVTGWIAQAQADKTVAERDLRQARQGQERQLTREEISGLVETLGDVAAALAEVEPVEKTDLYRHLGLRLTYQVRTNTVKADLKIDETYRGVMDRVRGGIRTITPPPVTLTGELVLPGHP
ncbi:hypothetical protein BCD48_32900 [Pseudofrankia sp. BMG5.36]|nr:hypothetical protein BCD48_32900 [Pseudofrankia sp. BMG5.36]